ncbi:MAG TPA: tetratricopeptide repeat protein [bacterium]|nr:tetratricopeptide repeat protein [bacterium]
MQLKYVIGLVAILAILLFSTFRFFKTEDYDSVPVDDQTKVSHYEMFCDTENSQASKAFTAAVDFEMQGNAENAIEQYLIAIEHDSLFCDAMDNLGRLYRYLGEYDKAIYWYKKSITILPSNFVAHLNLGVAYQNSGKIDEAITQFEKLIELDSNNAEGYYGLGNLHIKTNSPARAIPFLDKAIAIYENSSSSYLVDALYLKGLACFMVKDYGGAIELFEKVYPDLKNNPQLNYYYGLSFLYSDNKDIDKATQYLKMAERLGYNVTEEIKNKLKKLSSEPEKQ